MQDVTESQLHQALNAALELAELRNLADFPARAAQVVRELIPCEHSGYNAIDSDSGSAVVVADPPETVFDGGAEALAQFADQNPIIVRAQAGDMNVLRLSDHISRRKFHRTEIYDHVYKRIGLEYQLGAQLPSIRRDLGRPREMIGLSLCRKHRDFNDVDTQVLGVLQPLFAATLERLHELALLRALVEDGDGHREAVAVLVDGVYEIVWATEPAQEMLGLSAGMVLPRELRQWVASERERDGRGGRAKAVNLNERAVRARLVRDAYPGLDAVHLTPGHRPAEPAALQSLGLTPRQAEVMSLALQGRTSPEIAFMLHLSRRTVEKHFDAIYGCLGARNRSEAIAMALGALSDSG